MATIYPNFKNGKIISVKFKAYLGRDEDNKQIFRCKTWTPNEPMSEKKLLSQAERQATIWEHQLAEDYALAQKSFNAPDISFEAFVNTVWFPLQMNKEHRRSSTIDFHKCILKIALPYFGTKQLSIIQPEHIKQYLEYLKYTYRTRHNQPLSPKSIRHHYGTLNLIFSYAEKEKYILSNPVKKVDTPKVPKHTVDAFSKSQARIFLDELDKLTLTQRTIYTLILTTGIRRGECYGLMWQDIDLENMYFSINWNVTYTESEGVQIGLPKTDSSIRYVPLTKQAVALLKEYKEWLNKSYTVKPDMWVFPSKESPYEPHNPTYITKHMKKFVKRIGLPDMSPHDLRHTCASLMLQSGADVKSVQDLLGHADASTTLNFYAKSDINIMRASTQKAFDL